jgi:uncharacterized protein (TIGR03083 family)
MEGRQLTDVKDVVDELRIEHDLLVSRISGMGTTELERSSYAKEWSIAQVLSHLGSGAEINLSNLRAALNQGNRIPKEEYPQLWQRWDNLPSSDKAGGFERWHGELVASLEELGGDRLAVLEVETAMGKLTGAAVVGMRFREATVHAWDVAVAVDDRAVIRGRAGGILADQLPQMMDRLADPAAGAALRVGRVSILGFNPERSFMLSVRDGVRLEPGADASHSAFLRLPTESFVRLAYGRLDRVHSPVVEEKPEGLLEELRTIFTGL